MGTLRRPRTPLRAHARTEETELCSELHAHVPGKVSTSLPLCCLTSSHQYAGCVETVFLVLLRVEVEAEVTQSSGLTRCVFWGFQVRPLTCLHSWTLSPQSVHMQRSLSLLCNAAVASQLFCFFLACLSLLPAPQYCVDNWPVLLLVNCDRGR